MNDPPQMARGRVSLLGSKVSLLRTPATSRSTQLLDATASSPGTQNVKRGPSDSGRKDPNEGSGQVWPPETELPSTLSTQREVGNPPPGQKNLPDVSIREVQLPLERG